ncbi:hypothetical protein ONJ16_27110, partial [Salmonella enterica subsp. enterica serovar Montevideo]|nr:hypothetical protein [Salmonella enterica subsp. enterica serovar Montevideo]
ATVPDLLKIARDINSATYQPFTAFGIAAVLYLLISYVLISLLLNWRSGIARFIW